MYIYVYIYICIYVSVRTECRTSHSLGCIRGKGSAPHAHSWFQPSAVRSTEMDTSTLGLRV